MKMGGVIIVVNKFVRIDGETKEEFMKQCKWLSSMVTYYIYVV